VHTLTTTWLPFDMLWLEVCPFFLITRTVLGKRVCGCAGAQVPAKVWAKVCAKVCGFVYHDAAASNGTADGALPPSLLPVSRCRSFFGSRFGSKYDGGARVLLIATR